MAKRRTRKQKESAKHTFTISWDENILKKESKAKTDESKYIVKRQLKNVSSGTKSQATITKNAVFLTKDYNLASIRKDLKKSLIIASLILSLETVLYLMR